VRAKVSQRLALLDPVDPPEDRPHSPTDATGHVTEQQRINIGRSGNVELK